MFKPVFLTSANGGVAANIHKLGPQNKLEWKEHAKLQREMDGEDSGLEEVKKEKHQSKM